MIAATDNNHNDNDYCYDTYIVKNIITRVIISVFKSASLLMILCYIYTDD